MRRVVPALVLLSVLAGVMCASAEPAAGKAAAAKRKPKRVLFRTDSPRLFALRAPEPPTPTPAPEPARPVPAKPKFVIRKVRVLRVQSATTAPPALPRLRVTRAIVPPLPQPELPPRAHVITPWREEPRIAERFEIDFQPTSFTPYDRYLGTVKSVIARLDERDSSMLTACELVQECRGFRYAMNDLYRADLPAVTEARQAGDCKSKALWLYDHLGDASAYYVIGKLVARSPTSHAWLYWRNNGRWWILDPTVRSAPLAADSVAPGRYVPYYSFSRAGAFRHSATRLMVAANGINGIPAVTPTAAVRERSSELRPAPSIGR